MVDGGGTGDGDGIEFGPGGAGTGDDDGRCEDDGAKRGLPSLSEGQKNVILYFVFAGHCSNPKPSS